MARLVADKHTEAVVRQANARRVADAPLLAHAGLVKMETVEDRLALRRRVEEGTFWRSLTWAARDAATKNRARWYAYLCSLHPNAPAGLFERLVDERWAPPDVVFARARRTYARLLEGLSVDDDFEVIPAPWIDICRRHWLRLDVPPVQRKADMEAEIAAWKAAHPEEADAWEQRRRARAEAKREVVYHDGRYAA